MVNVLFSTYYDILFCMKKQIVSALFFIGIFTILVVSLIAYARGVRVDIKSKKLETTGLLVATSIPDGATVFIDDHLTTATNTTINLTPNDYSVKIAKEGYLPWQKKLKIQKEIVTKTDALLFPSNPDLRPLSVSGAFQPLPSPDGTKIIFGVIANGQETNGFKSGLYLLEMFDRTLPLSKNTRLIVKNSPYFNFSTAKLVWSPDSKSVLALFNNINLIDSEVISAVINPLDVQNAFLLQTDSENIVPKDITPTLSITLETWISDFNEKYLEMVTLLPKGFQEIATQSASILQISPDETKILYEASDSATLAQIIKPALIGTNTQAEDRNLKKGNVYVYDIKEDKNYKIDQKHTTRESVYRKSFWNLQWFPDSKHLIFVEKEAISILEYDNTNKSTVYAGPFEDSYVFPWPNGSKLVILTTLNKSAGTANLYSLGMK
mgnify:FL=1